MYVLNAARAIVFCYSNPERTATTNLAATSKNIASLPASKGQNFYLTNFGFVTEFRALQPSKVQEIWNTKNIKKITTITTKKHRPNLGSGAFRPRVIIYVYLHYSSFFHLSPTNFRAYNFRASKFEIYSLLTEQMNVETVSLKTLAIEYYASIYMLCWLRSFRVRPIIS